MTDNEFKKECYLCNQLVIWKQKDDGRWNSFNLDQSDHYHNTIRVSDILSHKHFPEKKEDKSRTIVDMTIQELEDRITSIAKSESAMKLGSYLGGLHGFGNGRFINKKIEVQNEEYYISGKLDGEEGDMIIEAKFFGAVKQKNKNLERAKDQCDIYGWITGKPNSKIILNSIDTNERFEELHQNNLARGEFIVKDYIEYEKGNN